MLSQSAQESGSGERRIPMYNRSGVAVGDIQYKLISTDYDMTSRLAAVKECVSSGALHSSSKFLRLLTMTVPVVEFCNLEWCRLVLTRCE